MYRPETSITLDFNSSPSTVMHMDLNSCFATIEQQANPFLRGKPLVVAAYTTNKGCILAASLEAKKLGVKTGMRVMDGKALCPRLLVLPSDPWKYRNVHLKLRKLISDYTNDFTPKSIDEFVLNMDGYLSLRKKDMQAVGKEIKERIKREIGDWLTVSVGIAPNRYLAKIAAGLKKPDGLDEINKGNFLETYSRLKLTDLTGIKDRNAGRLNGMGIYSVKDFYEAPIWKLKAAFHSITGLYWHTRLHGYEVDNVEYGRRSYGNSTSIGASLTKTEELCPILSRLTEKMSSRLRAAGYKAAGIHLMMTYKDGSYWHRGRLMPEVKFDFRDFYKAAYRLLLQSQAEKKGSAPALNIAVSAFGLNKSPSLQLGMFEDVVKKENVVSAVDYVNEKWGDFTVGSVRSMGGAKKVIDRIAFGGVKELEELFHHQL
jgi:DNA polymerase-4